MNRNLKLSQLFISFPQKEAPAILTAFDVKRARWLIMAILKTVLISFRRRRRKKKFNAQFFVKILSVYKLRYLVPDAVVCTYIYMCMYIYVEGIAWVNKSSCVNFIFSVRTIPTIKICGRHSLWKSTWLLRQYNWIYDYVLQGINNVPHIVQTFSLTYIRSCDILYTFHIVNFVFTATR